MRVYIAGPISGIENDNSEAFRIAFLELSEIGHYPVSPIDIGRRLKREMGRVPTWAEYMREDIKALMTCDGIYLLSGWNNSIGSCIEQQLAFDLKIQEIEIPRIYLD